MLTFLFSLLSPLDTRQKTRRELKREKLKLFLNNLKNRR